MEKKRKHCRFSTRIIFASKGNMALYSPKKKKKHIYGKNLTIQSAISAFLWGIIRGCRHGNQQLSQWQHLSRRQFNQAQYNSIWTSSSLMFFIQTVCSFLHNSISEAVLDLNKRLLASEQPIATGFWTSSLELQSEKHYRCDKSCQ